MIAWMSRLSPIFWVSSGRWSMAVTSLPAVVNVAGMLRARKPVSPVYCIYPHVYRETAREFVGGFPGRVLYAVKANDHPDVIRLLYEGGVRHFDCASVPEIARVRAACADATAYFMVPVRLRGAAREAQEKYGVRHFMVDHSSGIGPLAHKHETGDADGPVDVFGETGGYYRALTKSFTAEPVVDANGVYTITVELRPDAAATYTTLGAAAIITLEKM